MNQYDLPKYYCFGDDDILNYTRTAFLCSRNYPASAVLSIYDWAKAARDSEECVLSGFHSRLERDVLEILLKGERAIILVAARGLPKRYPTEIKQAIDKGRLLVTSICPASITRITTATANKRNEYMLTIADRIVIGYMSKDGALAATVRGVSDKGEVIYLSD